MIENEKFTFQDELTGEGTCEVDEDLEEVEEDCVEEIEDEEVESEDEEEEEGLDGGQEEEEEEEEAAKEKHQAAEALHREKMIKKVGFPFPILYILFRTQIKNWLDG